MRERSKNRVLVLLAIAFCMVLLVGSTAVAAQSGSALTTEASIDTTSVLYGRTVLFCGDSICAGRPNVPEEERAWAGRIGLAYGMVVTNNGRAAATVAVPDASKMGRSLDNRIINQVEAAKDNTYDYVILHGGINDGMDSIAVGTITDSTDVADFDVMTFAGALEELFARTQEYFGDTAQIGYIVNYQTPMSEWGGATQDMSEYVAMALQICDKWDISYLDLYNDQDFNDNVMKVSTKDNLSDYLHPAESGYDLLGAKIGTWMETLGQDDDSALPWIVGGVVAAVVVIGATTTGLILVRRKRRSAPAA